MESLGYILLYFLLGSLPWQGLTGKTKSVKYEAISDKKMATPVAELCEGAPSMLLQSFFFIEFQLTHLSTYQMNLEYTLIMLRISDFHKNQTMDTFEISLRQYILAKDSLRMANLIGMKAHNCINDNTFYWNNNTEGVV